MSNVKKPKQTKVQKIEAQFDALFDQVSDLPPNKRLAVTAKVAHRCVGRLNKEAEAALDG